MKNILFILAVVIGLWSCSTSKEAIAIDASEKEVFNMKGNDTVSIVSDKIEYEIIIIEPGFNFWLQSMARPRWYYSQAFLESRNYILVTEWNNRVLQPQRFAPNLYELQIDYRPGIDYGYEVNYQLYYYFVYFQRKYNQRLSGFLPRV